VQADDESLRQLFVNLILNATEAVGRHAGTDARVVLELDRKNDGTAVFSVKDSGPGPSTKLGNKIFDPFVTEKADGTGLGLYVARQIVETHKGAIRWRRMDDMTCFTVEIPPADSPTDSTGA